jgi:hypothetical protein
MTIEECGSLSLLLPLLAFFRLRVVESDFSFGLLVCSTRWLFHRLDQSRVFIPCLDFLSSRPIFLQRSRQHSARCRFPVRSVSAPVLSWIRCSQFVSVRRRRNFLPGFQPLLRFSCVRIVSAIRSAPIPATGQTCFCVFLLSGENLSSWSCCALS